MSKTQHEPCPVCRASANLRRRDAIVEAARERYSDAEFAEWLRGANDGSAGSSQQGQLT